MMRNPVRNVLRSRGVRRILPVAALVVGALALTGCDLGTHPGTNLGKIGFGAVVVDDAHGAVFVSGTTGNVVDVVDYSGKLVRTIPHVYGAAGMVIDGSALYVAESTGGAIVKLNLDDLSALPVTVASGIVQPRTLAITADASGGGKRLWTAQGSSTWQTLTSVDPATGLVTNFPTPTYYDPDLASSPGAPNTLFVAEDGQSPGAVTRLDVSGAAPVAMANVFTHQSNIEGLAVSPDGKRVIPAAGSPYQFEELDGTTLQPDGIVYPGQAYPAAVAVSPGKGGRLATGLTGGYVSPDINIDPLGVPEALHTASTVLTPNGTANVRLHGLALSAAGDLLVAVSADDVYGTNTIVTTWNVP